MKFFIFALLLFSMAYVHADVVINYMRLKDIKKDKTVLVFTKDFTLRSGTMFHSFGKNKGKLACHITSDRNYDWERVIPAGSEFVIESSSVGTTDPSTSNAKYYINLEFEGDNIIYSLSCDTNNTQATIADFEEESADAGLNININ